MKKCVFVLLAAAGAFVGGAQGAPTFNQDVAPVVFQNCAGCHRAGAVGPFGLTNYAEVKRRAETIADVVESKAMPPWHADEGAEKFHDARQLSDAQRKVIADWVSAGCPEGTGKAPALPKFPEGWTLGAPDVVLDTGADYALGAEGRDEYRCYVLPAGGDADRYVAAMQVQPGNPRVVHHVIAYIDTTGAARKRDEATPEPGYASFGGPGFLPTGALGAWVPGNEPRLAGQGMGTKLPKGADIVLQVHYHRSGKAETDRTRVGIYFAKGPVEKRLRTFSVRARKLKIPAGDGNYLTGGELPIPAAVTLHAIAPHMHLLGKSMTLTATFPDGSERKLVAVPDYRFNWQATYRFKEPVKLPAGTRLKMTARFDNSSANPDNPSNPPREARWGEQTTDEMCMAFLVYSVDSENIATSGEVPGFPDTFAGAGGAILQRVLARQGK